MRPTSLILVSVLFPVALLSACGSDEKLASRSSDAGTSDESAGASAAGMAGSGSTGGDGATDTGGSGGLDPVLTGAPIGGLCLEDTDCTSGLTCLTEEADFFGEGAIAQGFCTARCETAPESCGLMDPATSCFMLSGGELGYCLQTCQVASGAAIDPGKCDSNPLRRCEPLDDTTGFGACFPSCLDDNACAEGDVCSIGTGLCVAQQPAGKENGETCNDAEECSGGFCLDFHDGTGGLCSSTCTLSDYIAGCGFKGEAAAGLCLGALYADSELGDPGLCFASCDTDADCGLGTWQCSLFEDAAFEKDVGAKGLCLPNLDAEPPSTTDGGAGDAGAGDDDAADAAADDDTQGGGMYDVGAAPDDAGAQ